MRLRARHRAQNSAHDSLCTLLSRSRTPSTLCTSLTLHSTQLWYEATTRLSQTTAHTHTHTHKTLAHYYTLSHLLSHFSKPFPELEARARRSLFTTTKQKRPTIFSFELWEELRKNVTTNGILCKTLDATRT